MKLVDIIALGVGAGATAVYDGGASSAFLLRVEGKPVLLLDVGLGVVREAFNVAGCLPDHVYISHNHTDHAGELPVMLAVEAQKGHHVSVMAEPTVLNTLISHRLHELQSTGRQLSEFGCFTSCPAGQLHDMGCGLGLLPLKARHAERCFGLLLYFDGQPVLGWSADSGYDAALYSALAAAPVLLLDGRPKGTSEHAGFAQIAAAHASGLFRSSQVYVYGYGTQKDALQSAQYPSIRCITPGMQLQLAAHAQPAAAVEEAAAAVLQSAAQHPSADAGTAAAAAAAAAEATAAASAAATATAAAMAAAAAAAGVVGAPAVVAAAQLDVTMQDATQHLEAEGVGRVEMPGANEAVAVLHQHGCVYGDGAAVGVNITHGIQYKENAAWSFGAELRPVCRNVASSDAITASAPAGATAARMGAGVAGYPGVLPSPHYGLQQQQQHQAQVEQRILVSSGMHRQQQQQLLLEQQAAWRHHNAAAVIERRRQSGVSTNTSTSSSTVV